MFVTLWLGCAAGATLAHHSLSHSELQRSYSSPAFFGSLMTDAYQRCVAQDQQSLEGLLVPRITPCSSTMTITHPKERQQFRSIVLQDDAPSVRTATSTMPHPEKSIISEPHSTFKQKIVWPESYRLEMSNYAEQERPNRCLVRALEKLYSAPSIAADYALLSIEYGNPTAVNWFKKSTELYWAERRAKWQKEQGDLEQAVSQLLHDDEDLLWDIEDTKDAIADLDQRMERMLDTTHAQHWIQDADGLLWERQYILMHYLADVVAEENPQVLENILSPACRS